MDATIPRCMISDEYKMFLARLLGRHMQRVEHFLLSEASEKFQGPRYGALWCCVYLLEAMLCEESHEFKSPFMQVELVGKNDGFTKKI